MKQSRFAMLAIVALMVTGCSGLVNNQEAEELHGKLVKAGKLQIVTDGSFSLGSILTPSSSSSSSGGVMEMPSPNEPEGSEEAVATPVYYAGTYYVTFKESSLTVENNGAQVAAGDWSALGGKTILVVINDVETKLDVELSDSTIKIVPIIENTGSTGEGASKLPGVIANPEGGNVTTDPMISK